jgi:hypothetical protein
MHTCSLMASHRVGFSGHSALPRVPVVSVVEWICALAGERKVRLAWTESHVAPDFKMVAFKDQLKDEDLECR